MNIIAGWAQTLYWKSHWDGLLLTSVSAGLSSPQSWVMAPGEREARFLPIQVSCGCSPHALHRLWLLLQAAQAECVAGAELIFDVEYLGKK